MVIPARGLIGAMLCMVFCGCIATHRIQVIVSHPNKKDLTTMRHVCAAVAVRHGLTSVEQGRLDRFPGLLDEYATRRPTIFGGHEYTEPDMYIVDSPTMGGSAVITIGQWLDTPERSKIADDTLAALQREFGTNRVQRRDDRWTEF